MKIIFALIITFAITSCHVNMRELGRKFPERPDGEFLKDIARGSPDFQQGWEDGCTVGMSGGSNTFYKIFYKSNQIDGYKTMNSPQYNEAWNSAMWYCYRYDQIKNGTQASGTWNSVFGGYK